MTLNYWMMVERYPYLKKLAVWFLAMKFSLYLAKTLIMWSTASCALALAYRPSVTKIKYNKKSTKPLRTKTCYIGRIYRIHQTSDNRWVKYSNVYLLVHLFHTCIMQSWYQKWNKSNLIDHMMKNLNIIISLVVMTYL